MNKRYRFAAYSLALVGIGFASGVYIERDYSDMALRGTTSNLNMASGRLLHDICSTYKYKSRLLKGVIDQKNNDYNGVVVRQFIQCNEHEFTISSFIKTSYIPNQRLAWSMESSANKVTVKDNNIPQLFQKDFANIESVVLEHLHYGIFSLKFLEMPQEYRSQIDNSLATYSWYN